MEKRNVIDPDFTPEAEFTKSAENLEKYIESVFDSVLKEIQKVNKNVINKDNTNDASQSKL